MLTMNAMFCVGYPKMFLNTAPAILRPSVLKKASKVSLFSGKNRLRLYSKILRDLNEKKAI